MAVVILGGPASATSTTVPAVPAPAASVATPVSALPGLRPGASENEIVRVMADTILADSTMSGAVQQVGGRDGVELLLRYTRGTLDQQQSQVFDRIIAPTFGGMDGVVDYASGVISNMGGPAAVEQLAGAIRDQVRAGGGAHIQPAPTTGWSPGEPTGGLVNQVTGFVEGIAQGGGALGDQVQAAIDQVGGTQGLGLMVEHVLGGMGGTSALSGLADSFAQTAQASGGGGLLDGLLGGGGLGLGGAGLDGLLGGMMGGILG